MSQRRYMSHLPTNAAIICRNAVMWHSPENAAISRNVAICRTHLKMRYIYIATPLYVEKSLSLNVAMLILYVARFSPTDKCRNTSEIRRNCNFAW